MRLNIKAITLAAGILWGFVIFITGIEKYDIKNLLSSTFCKT